jgi:hypothetical protein
VVAPEAQTARGDEQLDSCIDLRVEERRDLSVDDVAGFEAVDQRS